MSDLGLTPDEPQLAEIILPDLAWEKILKYLTDPDDILKSGKTCTLFQRLLHSEIATAYFNKTLPVLMKYMDKESIRKCRAVSKGWRDGVDNFQKIKTSVSVGVDGVNLNLLGFGISIETQ